MSDNDTSNMISGIAGAVGILIKVVADAMGEPVADVQKRVLARIEADAADPTDETDTEAAAIDADLPSG